MEFAYEALSPDGQIVRARLDAADRNDAASALRGKGLLVVRLERAAVTPEGMGGGWMSRFLQPGTRDLVIFTRQMKMLLESGAPLVLALQAIEQQTVKLSLRRVIRSVREKVETGSPLSEALSEHRELFRPIFLSMISAGEQTGGLAEAFDRLSQLAHRQQQIRRRVAGAIVYPAVLAVMLTGVLAVLIGFVVPRFGVLFASLNRELPPVTLLLLSVSAFMRTYWPALLLGVVGVIAGVMVAARSAALRDRLDNLLLHLPFIGRLARRLELARVLRIWAALLRCRVPLIDTLHHSRESVGNRLFAKLVDDVIDSVSAGGRIGKTLGASSLIEPVLASAIATGEENGRLSESVDFVSTWLDEENALHVSNLTRAAEPLLLAVMGLIVGVVAMALFVPLFDIATASGG